LPKVLYKNLDSYENKGWENSSILNSKAKVDKSDYFNYGFDELTWKIYQDNIKKLYKENIQTEIKEGRLIFPVDSLDNNGNYLFNYLPSDFGGLDETHNEIKYEQVNFYNYKHNIKNNFIPILTLKKEKDGKNHPFLNLNIRGYKSFYNTDRSNPTILENTVSDNSSGTGTSSTK
jgi:hypothetical protein